jgi:1-acyl-sn-glycerol-3-phosphate acyltransferase
MSQSSRASLSQMLGQLGLGLDPDRTDARDPALIAALLRPLRWFVRGYLGLRAHGLEHVPRGPALFVANHNGGMIGPDIPCTLSVLWDTLGPEAPLYALAHDFAMRQLPVFGRQIQRGGAVRATPDNALRILSAGGSVLVYPGGDLDAYRHSLRRDEIVILPRTGFARVAQAANVPMVPIVAHGAHRSAVILTEGKRLASRLGMQRWARLDRFPIALALPWGIAPGPWLPYLPLPFPVTLRVLPPMWVAEGEHASEAAARVQAAMQAALDEMAGTNPTASPTSKTT